MCCVLAVVNFFSVPRVLGSEPENDRLSFSEIQAIQEEWSKIQDPDQLIGAKTYIKLDSDSILYWNKKRIVGKLMKLSDSSIMVKIHSSSAVEVHQNDIISIRVYRPVFKRISGYAAAGVSLFLIYVLAEEVRGRDLDLIPRGHALVNLFTTVPATVIGFAFGNRTRQVYKRPVKSTK